jgi:SAM-dependent methyltransferase
MTDSPLVRRLASGAALGVLPTVVDVSRSVPPNPPEALQMQFVGASFERAYAEAEGFVAAVAEQLQACGHPGLAGSRVLDLGSGWGRISRVLLTSVRPESLFAADVDPDMTALINVTLPGVNALTVPAEPPTVLAAGSMDVAVAFSVFSHLSAHAHEAWAHELARLLRPGGIAAVTVLGEDFIDLVEGSRSAVERGDTTPFATSMATVIDEPVAARAAFRNDQVQFWPTGGGGVRTSDYYGWAAAPRRYVERVWGDAGFELVHWRPSGGPISQVLAVLLRTDDGPVSSRTRRARRAARHAAQRRLERTGAVVPGPVVGVVRAVRRRAGQLKATSRRASR